MTADLTPQIERAARQHGLPPQFVLAIVEVESEGNPWAARYEPAFYDRYVKDAKIKAIAPCSLATERTLRATSFGPMQIMGSTAREVDFEGAFLTELCDPDIGLQCGCRFLVKLVRLHLEKHGWEGVAAAYNAGSPHKQANGRWVNEGYVEKIRKAGGFR